MHDLLPWRVKKLPDESFAYLVPDADVKTDAKKMVAHVIVSTPTLDRERDIMIPRGCRTKGHEKNPIVLLNHRKDLPGIARTVDPDGKYTVKTLDDEIRASNWFDQGSKMAVQAFRLVESGALGGISPGFLTVPNAVHKVKGKDGAPAHMYTEWDLVEISHCPIGMNPDAIVLAIEKGFGSDGAMLPELKEMLEPFVPEKRAQVVGGWESAKSLLDEDEATSTEIDLSDAEAVPLTASTQFYHAVYQKMWDSLGMTEELRSVQEVPRTKEDAAAIVALQGKILDICRRGHKGHAADYPGQPGLPGEFGEDIAPKEMAEWRVKALELYDEYKQQRQAVAAESSAEIKAAVDFLKLVANDRRQTTNLRAGARQFATRLEKVKMVSVVDDDDEATWGQTALLFDNVLQVKKS